MGKEDLISRQSAIEALGEEPMVWDDDADYELGQRSQWKADKLAIESVPPERDWIQVTERPPEELKAVNITWVNHKPEPYYHDIKDRYFVATGIYFHGHWYWYSTVCADYLGEYGEWDVDMVDDAVEIIAWMPLPEPWKGEEK